MIISARQFQTFEDMLQQPFAEYLNVLAQKAAPILYSRSGERGIAELVRHCLRKACDLQIIDKDYIELLLTTMLDLGRDFDSDPQYPWAASILHSIPRDTEYILARDLYRQVYKFPAIRLRKCRSLRASSVAASV